MTIYKIIQNTPLGPDDIRRLVTAYEQTLLALRLKERDDPITLIVAQKIFEVGQTGIEDAADISKLAIKQLGISRAQNF
jgi:hypothetical protein